MSDWTSFRDDSHLVHLPLPPELEVIDPFDGASARWFGGGVTAFYEVEPGGTVGTAEARAEALLAGMTGSTYRTWGREASHEADGRYTVSGQLAGDGSYIYERSKIRCGDLVRYRLQWNDQRVKPLVTMLTKAWVNDDSAVDSMGGVHPSC